jgi:hypothetical protein
MFSCRYNQSAVMDGRVISTSELIENLVARRSLEFTVPDEAVDHVVDISFDHDYLRFAYMVSDQDITIETNVATAGVDTISLIANRPAVQTEQIELYHGELFTDDVTAMYITNASGSTANVKMEFCSAEKNF